MTFIDLSWFRTLTSYYVTSMVQIRKSNDEADVESKGSSPLAFLQTQLKSKTLGIFGGPAPRTYN